VPYQFHEALRLVFRVAEAVTRARAAGRDLHDGHAVAAGCVCDQTRDFALDKVEKLGLMAVERVQGSVEVAALGSRRDRLVERCDFAHLGLRLSSRSSFISARSRCDFFILPDSSLLVSPPSLTVRVRYIARLIVEVIAIEWASVCASSPTPSLRQDTVSIEIASNAYSPHSSPHLHYSSHTSAS